MDNLHSPILKSLDPNINKNMEQLTTNKPECASAFVSLTLNDNNEHLQSVPLLDDNEDLKIDSEDSFMKQLGIPFNEKVKVVSIFGNTGEGKSFTLNKVFFNGNTVFRISSSQTSCTSGVWAMYDPKLKVICLDTEGLLGISKKENQRLRLLLKILAVSDIIIYRTRAERLQKDMYTFLGSASQAYKERFSSVLKKSLENKDSGMCNSGIGPGVIIFHETRYTVTLQESSHNPQTPEDILHHTFAELGMSYDSFSFIKYIGCTAQNANTSFQKLKEELTERLQSTETRSRRDAKYFFLALKSLNDKFHNKLSDANPQLYLSTFFTCQEKCLSCKNNCILSMGHKNDGEAHHTDKNCIFQHQHQNFVYLCKSCYRNGNRTVVTTSKTSKNSWHGYFEYIWSGYVIECPNHGEIYRSRQHWYGNRDPEDISVLVEIVHVWTGEKSIFSGQNSAQRLLDGVTMLSDVISNVGAEPMRVIGNWATDKIAPGYWKSNDDIKECFLCKSAFSSTLKIHHCRACGEGFCDSCSSKRQPVPSSGWYTDVRVCDDCYRQEPQSLSIGIDGTENRARQIGETVVSSVSVVKSVLDISKDFVKDFARPSYWTPDHKCLNCSVCENPFGPLLLLHHCRECGLGVCDDCSTARKPVPLRGWEKPVRVCDKCR